MKDAHVDYSKILRVIGQALASLQPEAYDIVCYRSCYLIRGLIKEPKDRERKIRALPSFLRLWNRTEQTTASALPNLRSQMNVELLYTLADLKCLDQEGKARRRDPNGMPEPYGLPTVLRGVGTYLNRKNDARLLLASGQDDAVGLLYETSTGARKVEEYPVSTLYDLWVKTYLKRKQQLQVAVA